MTSTVGTNSPKSMENWNECLVPIDSLPPLVFPGSIILVESPHQLPRVENCLKGEKLLGFDMEWKPELKPDQNHPIALIQISTRTKCVIFCMLKLGFMPKILRKILTNPSICKVGHSFDKIDAQKLWQYYHVESQNMVDLKTHANSLNCFSRLGLQTLTAEVFSCYLDKSLRCSDWASNVLTEDQILYAATDAWVTRELYVQLTYHLKCHVCHHVFKSNEALLQHRETKNHYTPERNFSYSSMEESPECQVCGKYFWSERARTQHQRDKDHFYYFSPDMLTTFGDEVQVDCFVCGKIFSNYSALQQHQQAKGHLHCQICGKVFSEHRALAQHQNDKGHYYGSQYFDSYYRGIQCEICRRTFFSQRALVQHQQDTKHGFHSQVAEYEFIPMSRSAAGAK